MIKITHLFLGFLLVTGPVNAGVGFVKGVTHLLHKSSLIYRFCTRSDQEKSIKKTPGNIIGNILRPPNTHILKPPKAQQVPKPQKEAIP